MAVALWSSGNSGITATGIRPSHPGKLSRINPDWIYRKGRPCYSVADLAKSLGISEEEAARSIAEKEQQHGVRQLFGEQETTKLQ